MSETHTHTQTHTHTHTHTQTQTHTRCTSFWYKEKKKHTNLSVQLSYGSGQQGSDVSLVTNHTPSLRTSLFSHTHTHTQCKSSLHSAVITGHTGFSPPLSAYCGHSADTRWSQVSLCEVKAPHTKLSGLKWGRDR